MTTGRLVYFIMAESTVYHVRRDCAALDNHYWPIRDGLLQEDGTIVADHFGTHVYKGRTRCKRCGKDKS